MSTTDGSDAMHLGSYLLYPGEHQQAVAADKELAILVLNQPIPHAETPLFELLWARASHRICVDGGGNRLYDLGKSTDTLGKCIPDAIVGDLDSLREEPRAYFALRGTDIHHISDQNSTDFMKGLQYLDRVRRAGKQPDECVVVVWGGLGGRLDHILHTLKVMFNNHLVRQMTVISDENLSSVLPKGKNKILVNKQVDGPTCGILPLAGEAVLTTKGLRWNLDHFSSAFEGMMSTSNIIDDPEVYIESSMPVVWTSEFRPLP
ncbi:thiamine pyrophosphokinase [Coemansia aciculifera]|uniref:Thiamine pyrophosphokinase n=1 Tax=Coemansia aciculifera TaxID=417176 RepID=A0ACC1M632_9FUNG|nr:thiamine pyrophosphokinase [Coemansia aciculifera]